MTGISGAAGHWFGLCPKAPVVRASQVGTGDHPDHAFEGSPDGGGGGSETIPRGIGSALSGIRTLNRNRQLLWFTPLAGLVLAGSAVGQSVLPFIDWPMRPYIIGWLVQNFLIEFATLFCLVFLLTGLVLSIPSKKEGSASFIEGLCGAKKYMNAIIGWSVILAFAGMLLFVIYLYFPVWLWRELGFLDIFEPNNLIRMLSQFPFNFTLDPRIFQELPGYGGRSLLILMYQFGFIYALIFSAINLLLFVLTPFVVPFVVLEQKTLREAIVGSFTVMRKTWEEVAACSVFLGFVVLGLFLTYLLVQAAHGMVTLPGVITYRSTAWIALGFLYDLALFSVAFVVATVGGIASLDLYRYAKIRADARIS